MYQTKAKIYDGLAILICLSFGLYAMSIQQFTVDSWTLFDLSKTFFGGDKFYSTNIVRQYADQEVLARSFPFLFPFLLATINLVLDWGIEASIVVNSIALLMIYFLFKKILSEKSMPPVAAFCCFILLLSPSAFLEEAQAGRTIPLTICLLLYVYDRLCSTDKGPRSMAFTAFLIGLLSQLRFDMLPVSAIGILCLLFGLKSSKHRFFAGLGYILGICPWVIYSWINFQKAWASDAGAQSWYAFHYYTLDYFTSKDSLPTLFSHPKDWLVLTFNQVFEASKNFKIFIFALPLVVFVIWRIYFDSKHPLKISKVFQNVRTVDNLIWILPLTAHAALILKSGFYQPRYFSFELVAFLIVLAVLIGKYWDNSRASWAIFFGSAGLFFVSAGYHVILSPHNSVSIKSIARGSALLPEEMAVHDLLLKESVDARSMLVLDDQIYYARFATLTGTRAFPSPSNFGDCTVVNLIQNYRINYVYGESSFELSKFYRLESLGHRVRRIDRSRILSQDFANPCNQTPLVRTLF
ncbi:MAG: hypothetical protein NT027_04635 [Proteobacteria bacterium]|nr:hypothetical protein [Pseudomonadota bacterium]